MNQDDFNYKALEQLKIISSLLESIERMLGEEKPLSPSEYKAIWQGEVEQEPEWRPMSTAPSNKSIRVKRFDTEEEFYAYWNKSMSVWECSRSMHPDANQFMTYEHELSGWRPL